jgi:hypothetical protein
MQLHVRKYVSISVKLMIVFYVVVSDYTSEKYLSPVCDLISIRTRRIHVEKDEVKAQAGIVRDLL